MYTVPRKLQLHMYNTNMPWQGLHRLQVPCPDQMVQNLTEFQILGVKRMYMHHSTLWIMDLQVGVTAL